MRVFLSACEASADLHGANLLRELAARVPVEAKGVGGERLRALGLATFARAEELSVMGLVEVLGQLPRLAAVARRVRRAVLAFRPHVAVLVDSPDFHLPLAKHLARAGIPVVLYVSPQLWAWRSGRVKTIRRWVRRVLCILPFEVDFYARHGVDARFVGHPLVDELAGVMGALSPEREHAVALLPGSRRHEVEALAPVMAEAFSRLAARTPGLSAKVIVAPGLSAETLKPLLGPAAGAVQLVEQQRYRELAACRAAFVASGTATLVCALLDVPMVVTYRLHPVSYLIARHLVRVPHVGLVNLVAGEQVAAELVQHRLTPEALAQEGMRLLGAEGELQRRKLAAVRARLGEPGASARAAEAVLELVEGA
jgi:lipid-A-disaccharide synthase